MNVVAKNFFEYNTLDEDGKVISPAENIVKFTKDKEVSEYNTIITAEKAAEFSLDKYYLNPSSATVALILNSKEELLVVRRKKDPAKGALDLPGGFVDMDETGEEGMAREVKEETGLDATEVKYQFSYPNLYLYSGFMVHTLDMFYEVKVKDDTHIEAMDDAEESFWIPLSRLNPDEFAFDSIRKGLHRYLETKLG